MPRISPYGTWPSPISAELITAGVTGLSALSTNGRALFWLESRPDEGGRNTLMMFADGKRAELTPAPFNVRTRVHEYGGGAYLAAETGAFFVNFADQNIYRVALTGGAPIAVTHTDADMRYADFVFDEPRARLIAVGERPGEKERENCLIAIDVRTGATTDLHRGHDFYSAPRLSPDKRRLCFLSWDHPNMPWDGTQLHVATLTDDGALTDDTIIAGGIAESIVQPEWLTADRILFASDQNGFWNLYSYDSSGIYCVYPDEAEYSGPAWTFGSRYYCVLGPRHVIAQRMHKGATNLLIIDVDSAMATPLPSDWQAFFGIALLRERLYFVGGSPNRLATITSIALDGAPGETIAEAGRLAIDPGWFAIPESIEYPTRDGATAYAYFYPPCNPDTRAAYGELPPLLVMSHGGPTAAAHPLINFWIQYYTTRGWSVADVNYGGSSGYGRAYRERLDGQWGVVDVHDCEDLVEYLAKAGRIDRERVAIRGGSAGGYTTLAALTFGDTFRAGASHYGIGDLETLARDTHKFESRYLDRLIGPYPQARDLYVERSPIHHVDRLKCPVVFFQGLEDRVVPPNQAEAMVDALRRRQLPVAYVAFPGEQHGFRQAANIKRALEGEYLFFARIFGFEPADALPPLDIEFLGSHIVKQAR
jgi:dipeptidyl aminopeptidase/acylaminoacyl peptidase